jgi:uncharacterized delta-60 repeat protein
MQLLPFILIILISIPFNKSFAQAGQLDSTFNADGKATTAFGGFTYDIALSIALAPDGKLVVGGFSSNGTKDLFAVLRYNKDGSLDNGFGVGGKVTTTIGIDNADIYVVAVQPDGKIIAAGSSSTGSKKIITIVRYNVNGTLDNTFSGDGKVTTIIGIGNDEAYTLAIQPDGKIVVGGHTNNGVKDAFALVRYNPDGTTDPGFGANGVVTTAFGLKNDIAYSIVLQPDGKIVAAGFTRNATEDDFAIARYLPDGTLDNGFGTGGKVITPVGTGEDFAFSVALQQDGKIVAAGYSKDNAIKNFALVRYNSNGTLDNTFGMGGKQTTPIGNGNSTAFSVAIQPDGKMLLAGSADNGANTKNDFVTVRYLSNGTLDNTFGSDGMVITDIGTNSDDYGRAMVIQPDGKILVAGYSSPDNSLTSDFTVVRYISGLSVGTIEFNGLPGDLLIYPNPVSDQATLEYTLADPEYIGIVLLDLEGRVLKNITGNALQSAGEHREKIGLPDNLPQGVYVIQITSPKGKVSVRIMK